MITYIFSQKQQCIIDEEKEYLICKNKILKMGNCHFIKIKNATKTLQINIEKIKNLSNIRKNNVNNVILFEIIDFDEDQEKLENTKNNLLIFNKHSIKICYENSFYQYYFENHKNTYNMFTDYKLYIINEINLLIFDLNNKSFSLYKVKEFKETNSIIELLVDIPYVNNVVALFCFDIDKKAIQKEFYYYNNTQKKINNIIDKYTLPYMVFHLSKIECPLIQKYVDNIDIKKLNQYFSKYDYIAEIDDTYYLIGKDCCEIKFFIKNNKIYDID